VSRYKQPAARVCRAQAPPVGVSQALWPVLLGLELGTRVRVMKRPFEPPAIQIDGFVESIQIDWDDKGEATFTLQCSPADLTPYGLFAAWHTTLKTTVSSGVSSITVNNSQDNTNPLAAQLAVGTQIVLGQNTANQETVTVSAVGATSAGWTSAVLTLTAPTTKAHTAGDSDQRGPPSRHHRPHHLGRRRPLSTRRVRLLRRVPWAVPSPSRYRGSRPTYTTALWNAQVRDLNNFVTERARVRRLRDERAVDSQRQRHDRPQPRHGAAGP
jgi:hypothetical protein